MTFKLMHSFENTGKTGLFVTTEKEHDQLIDVCLGIQFFAETHINRSVHISPAFYEIGLPLVGFPCTVSYELPDTEEETIEIDLYDQRERAIREDRFKILNRLYAGDEILKQVLLNAGEPDISALKF